MMTQTKSDSHEPSVSSAKLLLCMSAAVMLLSLCKYAFFPAYFTHEEPHYIEISWNLWQSKQWLILQDTHGLYLNKPPLLFWLTNVLWHITGPKDIWFYLLPAFATIATFFVQAQAFAKLWPQHQQWRAYTGLMLVLGIFFWQVYYIFNFDMIILACVAWAIYGLARVFSQDTVAWCHFSAALGVGLLCKGPVILLFTALPALLAPFVPQLVARKKQYMALFSIAVLVSLGLTLIWLYPLWQALGSETILNTLWHKGLGAANTYGSRPWYFYGYKFPLLLMPLLLLPLTWRMLGALREKFDPQASWCLLSLLAIIVVLSCIPGKASRYIFPATIYCSMLLTYGLAQLRLQQPGQQLQLHALASVLFLGQLSLGIYYYHFTQEYRAMAELADFLKQQSPSAIAYQRNYAGYHYSVSRKLLPRGPLIDDTKHWFKQHHKGLIVATTTKPGAMHVIFERKLNANMYIVVIDQA